MEISILRRKHSLLYGDIKETVLMALPPGFEKVCGQENVFKLKKSVYDLLSQLSRKWYVKFRNTLIEVGFKPLLSENCIFILSQKRIFVAIAIYSTILH